ncbi:TPA: hypothetical protein ACH3X2_006364 [Trebouxia sp. C0005]
MYVLLLEASSIVQELSQYYRQLADGGSIFCMDTDVSYCKGVNTDKDRASLCQQQEAQDKCHRSCSLCHPKTDTSSLVWYNQRSSLLRQQGGQVENMTESVQAQQGFDVDQQRLVLSLLNQTTTEASKDGASAKGLLIVAE